MKKLFIILLAILFLNGCAQTTSMMGPTYTMAKSGSILQAGNSFAASYGFKSLTGKTPGEYAFSSFAENDKSEFLLTAQDRECETFHSSSLSEIFFDTLDGIDCFRDPFSILK